ncbi:SDR family NAD(P)-dependent oxidoreductase [Magnetovibrio sp. PR-2]|uniref:SDR family NAD(P)-dependent oxidoreductase n=1 Tax=Magnetovibrio sp. PR-2 TaxID=3120356 RepID=UPI002FCE013C
MDFRQKHVVVTGGTGALGTAVVGQLLDLGATVHIPVFNAEEGERFVHKDHGNVHLVADIDLTDEALVEGFYQGVPGLWGSVHIAGGFDMSLVAETSAAQFDKQMSMNAKTCFLCAREAVKSIRKAEGIGRIVNIAARPGVSPREGAGMVAYAASKAAVAALSEAMGEELAPEGIFVNAVAPSILDTPANRSAMPDADHASWPKVEEVAATIIHLASPANGAARSAVVPVYGRV